MKIRKKEKYYLPELNRIIMCSPHNDLRHITLPKKALILKLQSNSVWCYLSIGDRAEALMTQSCFVSNGECNIFSLGMYLNT